MMILIRNVPHVWAIDLWAGGYATFSERGRCSAVVVRQFSSAPRGGYQYSCTPAGDAAAVPLRALAGHPEHRQRVRQRARAGAAWQ